MFKSYVHLLFSSFLFTTCFDFLYLYFLFGEVSQKSQTVSIMKWFYLFIFVLRVVIVPYYVSGLLELLVQIRNRLGSIGTPPVM